MVKRYTKAMRTDFISFQTAYVIGVQIPSYLHIMGVTTYSWKCLTGGRRKVCWGYAAFEMENVDDSRCAWSCLGIYRIPAFLRMIQEYT
jgi:hypothetical protein